jgi:hypothetical protein
MPSRSIKSSDPQQPGHRSVGIPPKAGIPTCGPQFESCTILMSVENRLTIWWTVELDGSADADKTMRFFGIRVHTPLA